MLWFELLTRFELPTCVRSPEWTSAALRLHRSVVHALTLVDSKQQYTCVYDCSVAISSSTLISRMRTTHLSRRLFSCPVKSNPWDGHISSQTVRRAH